MATSYRFTVRTIHGVAKFESELTGLSSEGWEPISFAHDAAGNFEVVLRQENGERPNGENSNSEHSNGAIERSQVSAVQVAAPAHRYAARSVRGAAKLESELNALAGEGWEPLNIQHEAAAVYEIILHQPPGDVTSRRYAVRTVHGVAKLQSELADLSSEGWEPIDVHRDGAGSYEVVIRR